MTDTSVLLFVIVNICAELHVTKINHHFCYVLKCFGAITLGIAVVIESCMMHIQGSNMAVTCECDESIRAMLLLHVVNITGFCLLSRNCDFYIGSSLYSEEGLSCWL